MNPIDREKCPDWQEWKRQRNLYYGTKWPDSTIYVDSYAVAEAAIKRHLKSGHYKPLSEPIRFHTDGTLDELPLVCPKLSETYEGGLISEHPTLVELVLLCLILILGIALIYRCS